MTQHHMQARSVVRRLAIVLALTASVVGLSQCRSTNDSVTGVELNNQSLNGGSSGTRCIRRCNERYKISLILEAIRHKIAKKSCGHDSTCKKAEERKHQNNLDGIRRDRERCKRACYNEGGGSAGA